MNCPLTCPQKRGHGQGRGCECSTRATRYRYALIANRLLSWAMDRPEEPALALFVLVWTWFTWVNWNSVPF